MNGIFHVTFKSSMGHGGEGLAVVKDGAVNGGDTGYLYQGSLSEADSQISGTLQISRWNRASVSIFGPLERFALELTGMVDAANDGFTVAGGVAGQPGLKITIRGRRIAEAA